MVGKKFTSLIDGRIVEIKDIFEDIVILNDNTKIKASRLLDKSYYDEYIDPSSFFQNQSLLSSFAQKIKQIPDDVVNKMSDEEKNVINESLSSDNKFKPSFNEPAILQADPEMEKLELMRKYGIKDATVQNNPVVESMKQMDRFKSIIEELQSEEETVQRVEVNREPQSVIVDDIQQPEPKQIVKVIEKVEDPIITMFKNVKRNKDFKISVDIENKIPRPDFIEMMEDSYNTSIIEFLADEFTNQILKNPELIKDKIKSEIRKIVYGEKIEQEIKPTAKPTTKARKPRAKKLIETND